jgi:UDP-2,4-diacetamido-2,4,6-trideoxy-beta-L-altropyranose hydrolase
LIKEKGFELLELSPPTQNIESKTNEKLWLGCNYQDDVEECLQVLRELTIDLLIVDHYSLDYQWHKLIKYQHQNSKKQAKSIKIMVIDDLANRKHDCDILLDQTLGRKTADYNKLVPNHCLLLLGADFIMLRDEFLQSRQLAESKRKQSSAVSNILITMGGTDPDNVTEKLLNWLIKFKQTNNKILVTVVINSASPFIKSLKKISLVYDWITIVNNPKSMAKLMLTADIAIGSSGATAWERCCLGLPSLSIISAENQNFLSENLSKAGAIINLGHFTDLTYKNFVESLKRVINVTGSYQKMVAQSFACCDGLGVTKVVKALLANLSSAVSLQEASYDDCQTLFEWQSNNEVRKYFHNPEPVKWQQHCDWLENTLANTNKHLYIIKLITSGGEKLESVGVLRLDAIEYSQYAIDANWEISIIISPEYQGRNFAERAIRKIPESFKNEGIVAEVHRKNAASHKLFSRAGFTEISPTAYLLKRKRLKNKEQLGEVDA